MYLFNSEIPKNKSLLFALKQIYGLNKLNNVFLKKLGFCNNLKTKNLSTKQTADLIFLINSYKLILSNDLRKFKFSIFKKLIDIKSIRGFRLNKGLPVRGQRTHTNAKTAKKKLFV